LNNKTILLTRRLTNVPKHKPLLLELTAEERKQLRGRKKSLCGVDLLLQLPRKGALSAGELLVGEENSPQVLVTAAKENLFEVTAKSFIDLLKATYHLGNRHVELEISRNKIYLKEDLVLEKMLLQRGLLIKNILRVFEPEEGAYMTHSLNSND
tara:strand:+ start:26136 stop:26597 length:462 start_codon:yes stop_codon:yes gene_type:complete